MGIFLFVAAFISLILLVLGMFRPSLALKWGRKDRRTVFITYSIVFLACSFGFIILAVSQDSSRPQPYMISEKTRAITTVESYVSKAQAKVDPDNSGQQWAMINLIHGSRYDLGQLSEKLGKFEQVQVTRWNPQIIKGYFFPESNITVFLNSYKADISHWRLGRASE